MVLQGQARQAVCAHNKSQDIGLIIGRKRVLQVMEIKPHHVCWHPLRSRTLT